MFLAPGALPSFAGAGQASRALSNMGLNVLFQQMGHSRLSQHEVTSPQWKNNWGMSRVDLWVWRWGEERHAPSLGAPGKARGQGRSSKAVEGSEGPTVEEPAQPWPGVGAGDVDPRVLGIKSPQPCSQPCLPPPILPQLPAPCDAIVPNKWPCPLPLRATALCLCDRAPHWNAFSSSTEFPQP